MELVFGIYTDEICLWKDYILFNVKETLLKYEIFKDTQLNIMPDNKTFILKPSDSFFWHLHRKMSPCHLSGKRYQHFSTTFYSFETPQSFYLLQALASHTFQENFLIMLAAWHSHIPPLKGETDMVFHTFAKIDKSDFSHMQMLSVI